MRSSLMCLMCVGLLWSVRAMASAGELVVPAGTLIHCTLNEENFSSATADIGDPVVCHLASLQEFGHSVFPRGSYLAGHLEADKEPGHLAGKGYLKLQFDRIGLPDSEVPVPSKVIGARGYRVDKQGDIMGKGHAKRDVAEWMFPPLWPWKLVTLPARGPRPALKGEEQISLRLMEDIVVPTLRASNGHSPLPGPGWHYFGEPSSHTVPSQSDSLPPQRVAGSGSAERAVTEVPASTTLTETAPANKTAHTTLLALKSDETYNVTAYRVSGRQVSFVLPSGSQAAVDVSDVDWRKTSQLNERGVGTESRATEFGSK